MFRTIMAIVRFLYRLMGVYIAEWGGGVDVEISMHQFPVALFFFLLALQPPMGIVFYSPLVDFSLLACEVS